MYSAIKLGRHWQKGIFSKIAIRDWLDIDLLAVSNRIYITY